eukprot:13802174-Alexandrium_andersonii.AAC.1
MGASSCCRFMALERTFRALGEALTAAFSSWALAAESISAKGLFRDAVVLTLGPSAGRSSARSVRSPSWS